VKRYLINFMSFAFIIIVAVAVCIENNLHRCPMNTSPSNVISYIMSCLMPWCPVNIPTLTGTQNWLIPNTDWYPQLIRTHTPDWYPTLTVPTRIQHWLVPNTNCSQHQSPYSDLLFILLYSSIGNMTTFLL
jgi:hypothetical protein